MQSINSPQNPPPFCEEPGKRRLPLKRTFSAPQLNRIEPQISEIQEIGARDGKLWKCVDRSPHLDGGYLYRFRLRKRYDINASLRDVKAKIEQLRRHHLTKEQRHAAFEELNALKSENRTRVAQGKAKLREIFPAVEKWKAEELWILNEYPLRELGYLLMEEDGYTYIQLPDHEALELNWEKLRQKEARPLPAFHLLEMTEAATDLQFIVSHLTHDALLSKKEFVHDHQLHIIPTLLHLYLHPEERAQLVKRFAKGYRTLLFMESTELKEKRDRIQAAFSAFIDISTTSPGAALSKPESHLRKFMMQIWVHGTNWSRYFHQRFPKSQLKEIDLSPVWKALLQMEKAQDRAINQSKAPQPLSRMDKILFAREGQRFGVDGSLTVQEDPLYYLWPRYQIHGKGFGMTIKPFRDSLQLGPFSRAASHPELIDAACQYARVHKQSSLTLHLLPRRWLPFFEWGFRLNAPNEAFNDALLIEYARKKGLWTFADERLLVRAKTRAETCPLHLPLSDHPGYLQTIPQLCTLLAESEHPSLEMVFSQDLLHRWSASTPIVPLGKALIEEELKSLRCRLKELFNRNMSDGTCKIL